MYTRFHKFFRQHILLVISILVVMGCTALYLVMNNTERVEANFESTSATHTIQEKIPADTVRFTISFVRSNTNEQSMYNTVLAQTTPILEALSKAGIQPTEYEISHEVKPPKGKKGKFEMTQTIQVESSTTASAKAVYPVIKKIKNVKFTDLQYGFSDFRPIKFHWNGVALEKARLAVEDKIKNMDRTPVELKSINGNSNIEMFNPAPISLNDPNKKIPYFPETQTKKFLFNDSVPINQSVTVEYFFK